MDLIVSIMQKGFSYIGPFFILLGMLIFIHEMGHFLVAKFFKVRVEVFSLGFGKKLFKFVRGETSYCLSLIPLGGYVKMYGDDPTMEVPEGEKKHAFLHKPVGQRIAIVMAGPLMNLFFATFLFAIIALLGERVSAPVLGDIAASSVAGQSGLQSGDHILSASGEPITHWDNFKEILESSPGKVLKLRVEREHSKELVDLEVPVTLMENENVFGADRQVGGVPGLQMTSQAPIVGVWDPKGLAGQAGVIPNDLVLEINDKPVEFYRNLSRQIAEAWPSGLLKLKVRSYEMPEERAQDRVVEIKIPEGQLRNAPSPETALKSLGLESADLYLLAVNKKSPAAKAGLQGGDRMVALNGIAVKTWEDILDTVKGFQPTQKFITFEVRRGSETLKREITPELTELMNDRHQNESRYTVGIRPAILSTVAEPVLRKTSNPLHAVHVAIKDTWNWNVMVVMSFVRLVQNEVSPRNIAGVITIGRVASTTYEMGLAPFLKIMAIISINLFLINMLPVPVLDGGHLVFFSIEALRGAPISLRKMEIAQQVGMVILMTLMVFALFNDVSNLFNSTW